MTSNFERVREFMRAMEQNVPHSPKFPSQNIQQLRIALIEEEISELKDAIQQNDLVEVADALADILYVVYGAGLAFGIDLDKCFREVHRSNMTKLDADGNPIKNPETGKIVKGPHYEEPQLERILRAQESMSL